MAVSPPKKAGPNTIFNGLVTECESLTQDAQGVSSSTLSNLRAGECVHSQNMQNESRALTLHALDVSLSSHRS